MNHTNALIFVTQTATIQNQTLISLILMNVFIHLLFAMIHNFDWVWFLMEKLSQLCLSYWVGTSSTGRCNFLLLSTIIEPHTIIFWHRIQNCNYLPWFFGECKERRQIIAISTLSSSKVKVKSLWPQIHGTLTRGGGKLFLKPNNEMQDKELKVMTAFFEAYK